MSEPTETSAAEHVTPEVVEQRGGEVVPMNPQHSAIERAAEAALSMPGIPGRDEFLSLAMQARILSMSDVAPKGLRGNPHVAFHVCMIGRDLGISPSAAIELIDVIGDGQDARPSMSPQLLNGQIRRLGLGRIVPVEVTTERAVARALGPRDEQLGPDVEFTWEDAQIAGLVDMRCPDARTHWKKEGTRGRDRDSRCDCRQGWRTYPRRMLWWRAAGFAADDYFPEAGLGLYTAEELGAVVDEDGRPIDPADVELPQGYEPKAKAADPSKVRADADELWLLQERIHALPAQEKADLKDRWQQTASIKGVPAWGLSKAVVNTASALVRGFEAMAKRGGWDPDAALVEVRSQVATALMVAFGLSVGDGEPAVEPPAGPDATDGAAQQDPGADAAQVDVGPDPGTPAGSPSPERIEQVIALVQGLSPGELTGALRARQLPATGNDDTRRRRLCEAILTGES